MTRQHLTVTGTVQGVGFRPFVQRQATRHGLSGWVLNNGAGVVIEAQGEAGELKSFAQALLRECPPLARIAEISVCERVPQGEQGFSILASQAPEGRSAAIPPDAALCPECERELLDRANRRYRYPFINCTQCGPRFTIVEEVPYDRPNTTMRAFAMCELCAAEYTDPADRRFHAEPIACPLCGPACCLARAAVNRLARVRDAAVLRPSTSNTTPWAT